MNLPNYFIADLPQEAVLTPGMVTEACLTLKRNRQRYLADRSTQSLIDLLCHTGKAWLHSEFPFRKIVMEQAPASTGFAPETLAKGLDHFFGQFTPNNFEVLLQQDLGTVQRLERMSCGPGEEEAGRAALVSAPELLVQMAAGNVPISVLTGMVLGVLLRSAQFVKCATGAALVPRLFAHSLYETDPKLGACIELAEWRGGNRALEQALFDAADCVTASGSDETISSIRQRLPLKIKMVPYGHRVSFAFISSEVMSGSSYKRMVEQTCEDVVAWNQLGCLSPHVIYVQDGGLISPEKFAELLAGALEEREKVEPRGEISVQEAAAIASRRSVYEVRAAEQAGTRQWCSKDSTAWTVVFELDSKFQLSCLNRFVYVKQVRDLTEALQGADSVRGMVSSVGLGSLENKSQQLATELARWGVTRVCPIGSMQKPPLTWRHDGRPPLGEFVTWTDWEME